MFTIIKYQGDVFDAKKKKKNKMSRNKNELCTWCLFIVVRIVNVINYQQNKKKIEEEFVGSKTRNDISTTTMTTNHPLEIAIEPIQILMKTHNNRKKKCLWITMEHDLME